MKKKNNKKQQKPNNFIVPLKYNKASKCSKKLTGLLFKQEMD